MFTFHSEHENIDMLLIVTQQIQNIETSTLLSYQ